MLTTLTQLYNISDLINIIISIKSEAPLSKYSHSNFCSVISPTLLHISAMPHISFG